jgi:excisionase family DNA binding protein
MPSLEPQFVPLPRAPALFGLSRSALYRLAADGRVRMVKMGARTLVDAESVRAFLATLPPVEVRPDPRRRHGHAEVVAAE